LHDNGTQL
jgi:Ca2+-binding RTX toxin-like protein